MPEKQGVSHLLILSSTQYDINESALKSAS